MTTKSASTLNKTPRFALPLTNNHFAGSAKVAKSGSDELTVLFDILNAHAHLGDGHLMSYARNRLALVCELCDILGPEGRLSEVPLQMLEFINPAEHRNCRETCCKKDLFPLLLKHVRDSRPSVYTERMAEFLKICMHFDWFDWFAEQVHAAAKNETDIDQGAAASAADATKARKKRRIVVSIVGEREVVSRWNEIRKFFGLSQTATTFEYGSLQRPDVVLSEAPAASAAGDFRIALVSGLLPLSIETRFALAYARLCASGRPSLLPRIQKIYTASGVIVIDQKEFALVDKRIFGGMNDEGAVWRVFGPSQNFGLDLVDGLQCPNIPRVVDLCDDGPFFASILLHVKHLRENLSWTDLVDRRRENVCVLNPLFFLTHENLVASGAEVQIAPVLGIDIKMLPSQEFVERHLNNVGALLSNNLARFLYFIATRSALPRKIGQEYDDEDGTSRTEFMFKVSPFSLLGTNLQPKQMHCLACLYFGDFDFANDQHRSQLLAAFGNSLSAYRTRSRIRDLQQKLGTSVAEFSRRFLQDPMPNRASLTLTENANDNRDLAILFCKQSSYPLIGGILPYLRRANSRATGVGPHVEIARQLLLSACRHESFFLEINDSRRTIVPRKNLQISCRICSEQLDNAPCIFVHDSDSLAASRAIACECILLRIDLPVTFSFGAIVAVFRIQLDNERVMSELEYADSGPIAQRISTLSMAEHAQLSMPAAVFNLGDAESHESRVLRSHFGALGVTALFMMYAAINKLGPFEKKKPVSEIDVDVMREVVFRLCKFQSSKISSEHAQFLQKISAAVQNNAQNFAVMVRNFETTDQKASLRILSKIVETRRHNRTLWSFLVWLLAATRDELCAFVTAMGSDPSLIALYSQDTEMRMTHRKYRVSAEQQKILEDGVYENETLLTNQDMPLNIDVNQSDVLSSDQIAIVVSTSEQRHAARIATCFRTLTLMTDLRPSQLTPSMNFLIESPDRYNSS